jgi:hypothetical protein
MMLDFNALLLSFIHSGNAWKRGRKPTFLPHRLEGVCQSRIAVSGRDCGDDDSSRIERDVGTVVASARSTYTFT